MRREGIPANVLAAAELLRVEALAILGEDLVAVWLYGAAVFPDPPAVLGDLDAHVIVARPLSEQRRRSVEALKARIDTTFGVEPDTWWILAADAGKTEQPVHQLDPSKRDTSWALHRLILWRDAFSSSTDRTRLGS